MNPNAVNLIHGDAIEALARLPAGSVDVVIADPPYFLSGGGTTCRGGRRVAVDKGAWDRPTTPAQQQAFGILWMAAARRVLRPTGSMFVCGTSHSIHHVYAAAVDGLGMEVINDIVWEKPNPPPNLSCRGLQHASESILWLKLRAGSPYHFDYAAARALTGKQMRSVWSDIYPPTGPEKFRGGKHSTQKPVALFERCLMIACPRGGDALDPFLGSGTSAEAAARFGCGSFVGVDVDDRWVEHTRSRLRMVAAEERAA